MANVGFITRTEVAMGRGLSGFEIFSGTHSSCMASGFKLLFAFNQVVLVLTFGTVTETKS